MSKKGTGSRPKVKGQTKEIDAKRLNRTHKAQQWGPRATCNMNGQGTACWGARETEQWGLTELLRCFLLGGGVGVGFKQVWSGLLRKMDTKLTIRGGVGKKNFSGGLGQRRCREVESGVT